MKNEIWYQALRITASLSGWIAFPVIIAIFFGKWLDKQFNSEPWLFLVSVGLAFLVSMYGLVAKAQAEFKRIAEESQTETKDKEDGPSAK